MAGSLKTNYIYNLINTISSILFPLFAFPYAARIMGADGIGRINFLAAVIGYVSLFTSLGIPMYAIRQIAKVRNDEYLRNQTAKEILSLHLLLSLFGYCAIILLAIFVNKINQDYALFLLLSSNIFFTACGCEWFYQGVEDFKYITIRGLIVKAISIIFLFLLVKTKEDIYWYAGYSVVGSVGGNLFNLYRLGHYLKLPTVPFRKLNPFKHLGAALHIFVMNLVISLYVNLNTVMLGFMHNSESVGLFTGATRITGITLSFVSALGTVMLPRLSNLLATGKQEEFRMLSQKAFTYIFALSLPLTVGIFCCSNYIILLFCGDSYLEAITTLQIISPIILMIALSGVMGIQILYPQGFENKVIICTLIGAIVNIILNVMLIPQYAQNGAAVGTVLAEIAVTISMIFIGRKFLPISFGISNYLTYIIAASIMFAMIYPITLMDYSMYVLLPITVLLGVAVYSSVLYVRKDPFLKQILRMVCNKK